MLFGSIDLLLVDEIHHLGEERGATLETVVLRMKILNETYVEKTARDNGHAVTARHSSR
jgi:replicative superfamily II helicase